MKWKEKRRKDKSRKDSDVCYLWSLFSDLFVVREAGGIRILVTPNWESEDGGGGEGALLVLTLLCSLT